MCGGRAHNSEHEYCRHRPGLRRAAAARPRAHDPLLGQPGPGRGRRRPGARAGGCSAREKEAESQEFRATIQAVFSCQICGEGRGLGARDGLCPQCRLVANEAGAQRFAEDQIQGHTRRELVLAFLERTGG